MSGIALLLSMRVSNERRSTAPVRYFESLYVTWKILVFALNIILNVRSPLLSQRGFCAFFESFSGN